MNPVEIIGGGLLALLTVLLGLLMLALLWLCVDLAVGTVNAVRKRQALDLGTYAGSTALTRRLIKTARRGSLWDAVWVYGKYYLLCLVLAGAGLVVLGRLLQR